jgi:hypothetical protein
LIHSDVDQFCDHREFDFGARRRSRRRRSRRRRAAAVAATARGPRRGGGARRRRARRASRRLKGYPGDLTPDKWDESLDKMIAALEIELHGWDTQFMKMYFGDFDRMKHEETLRRKKEEGFKLLGKYLSHLWW